MFCAQKDFFIFRNDYLYKRSLKSGKLKKHLYLIALLPSEEILEEIRLLKEELKFKFSVSHALKLPAHITLQQPFWMQEENEEKLLENLTEFSRSQTPFSVELNDFDTFTPRVIFVKISDHSTLIQFQRELQQYLPMHFFVSQIQRQKEIHPHIALATRDLTREVFPELWKLFQNRKYQDSFIVNSIHLFKHDGEKWNLFRNFEMS